MLINLSNHPYERWSPLQREKALIYGQCIDWTFPAIDAQADEDIIEKISNDYFTRIVTIQSDEPITVHIMGEHTFCYSLIQKLREAGIHCIASCSKRNVAEEDEEIKRVSFRFERFRFYH